SLPPPTERTEPRIAPRPARVPVASTSEPELWKAHGTAEPARYRDAPEPRSARLLQTAQRPIGVWPIAVLEQPSSRRVPRLSLGRRNIVLLQSSELNASARTK